MALAADFHIINHGSIVTFQPLTEAAEDWWDAYVDDAPAVGGAYAVDHRYADSIIEGLADEGFSLGGLH